jgi:hypothetical protein
MGLVCVSAKEYFASKSIKILAPRQTPYINASNK